jgi:hypothetical protein
MSMAQVPRAGVVSLDALSLLIRKADKEMRESAKLFLRQPIESCLQNLRITVEKIGSAPIRRPPPLERYMLQWSEFESGKRTHLDRGTMRYLCWEPQIATSSLFLTYLRGSGMPLNRRSLEGLVRSCHSKWVGSFSESSSVDTIKSLVGDYTGPNPVLVKWKSNIDAILGKDGPEILARGLVNEDKTLHAYLDEWYLESQSPFVRSVVEAASAKCREQLDRSSAGLVDLLFRELLPWPCWTLPTFKKEIGALVLHGAATGNIQEILRKFVLNHKELGDPRFPTNRIKWAEVPEEARERVLQWLCNDNTSSFCDHVYREDKGWGWRRREERTDTVQFG